MDDFVSPSPDIAFRPFAAEHLDAGVALSTAVGWSHRREDWEMLFAFSRGVAALHNDRVVGTALRADFGKAVSTINMIIVEEAMRSRGLGRALMTAALGTDTRSLRLIATIEGQPLYEKLGFETVEKLACVTGIVKTTEQPTGVRDVYPQDLPEIITLESVSFGSDRSALIKWLDKNTRMAVIVRNDRVVGFAARRRFGHGHVIGPVVAQNTDDGMSLVAYLAEGLEGQLLRLDVPEASGLQFGLGEMGLEVEYLAPIMQRGPVTATSERLAFVSQALI